LKSGGSLLIEQTEAMSTVDVNTGAFVGHTIEKILLYWHLKSLLTVY